MLTDWLAPALAMRPALLPQAAVASATPDVSLARWQQALQAAGLGALLCGPGAWTLFAPTDDAFQYLLEERAIGWPALLADRHGLRELLLGHVMTQRHSALRLPAGLVPALAADGLIEVAHGAAGPLLRDAEGRDVRLRLRDQPTGTNGRSVTHVIDRVLQPPRASLLEQLERRPEFSAFTEALRHTDLADLLRRPARLTVLAPHNDGFRHLAARLGLQQRELMARPALLRELLAQHLLPGRWLSSELPWGSELATLASRPLALAPLGLIGHGDAAQPLLGGSDQLARNGVLHRLATPVLASHG